ncbi:hypothetical protein KEM55_008321, partial [Ascosphaera atra]
MPRIQSPENEEDVKLEEQTTSVRVDPDTVDWDGPDDPLCPQNWPPRKSFGYVFLVSSLCMIV